MAKNIVSNRVPSQNVVTGVIPVIAANDPLKIFLRQGSYIETDANQTNLYNKYITAPSTGYTVKEEPTDPEDPTSEVNLVSGAVDLSGIESVTSEIYYDSLGNPRVKYIIKIRNLSLDKDNVAGVDARLYKRFA